MLTVHVTLTADPSAAHAIEATPAETVADLTQRAADAFGTSAEDIALHHEGNPLELGDKIAELALVDGDAITARPSPCYEAREDLKGLGLRCSIPDLHSVLASTRSEEEKAAITQLMIAAERLDISFALHEAAGEDCPAAIEALAAVGDLNEPSPSTKETPLHVAADNGCHAAVKQLLCLGANVDARNSDWRTPLFIAVSSYHSRIVKELAAHGADVNRLDKYGETALGFICWGANLETVQVLLELGADVNKCGSRSPLFTAVEQGNAELAEILLTHGAEIEKGRDGVEVLHAASMHCDAACVDLLLTHGANVNCLDVFGRTALHVAGVCENLGAIASLAAQGTDIDAVDNSGCTALWAAASAGRDNSVRHLIALGADPTKADECSVTPADAARQEGHTTITTYLTALADTRH